MSIKEYIGGQCANPEGLGGIACAKFMNFFNAEHYRAVKKFVCKLDGARILDIGFGNGVTIKKLSKNINAKFYGVDISADMVEKAKRENDRKNPGCEQQHCLPVWLSHLTYLPGRLTQRAFADIIF